MVVVVSAKLVLNTNYVLEEEIAENTVPLPPKKKAWTEIPETER